MLYICRTYYSYDLLVWYIGLNISFTWITSTWTLWFKIWCLLCLMQIIFPLIFSWHLYAISHLCCTCHFSRSSINFKHVFNLNFFVYCIIELQIYDWKFNAIAYGLSVQYLLRHAEEKNWLNACPRMLFYLSHGIFTLRSLCYNLSYGKLLLSFKLF